MSVNALILGCILCFVQGTLNAPFLSPGLDAAPSADEPDLLQMLEYFKGKPDTMLITNLIKQFKLLRAYAEKVTEICLPCKQVFADASKHNVAYRILYKVAEGHAPDIKDMYDLATQGIGNLGQVFRDERKKNKNYQILHAMFKDNTSLTAPNIDRFMNLLTGKQFSIDSDLLKEVNDGNVKVTNNNVNDANLILLLSTWQENNELINHIGNLMFSNSTDIDTLLTLIQNIDVSMLSRIVARNEGLDNNKYTVIGHRSFQTDPAVLKFMQDQQKATQLLKQTSHDQAAAESILVEAIEDGMDVTVRVIKNAEISRKVSSIQS